MNEAKEILQRNISGCTINSKGQITRIWYYGKEQFFLDVKTRTIKAKYDSREFVGISANAVKMARKKAREWRDACSSE